MRALWGCAAVPSDPDAQAGCATVYEYRNSASRERGAAAQEWQSPPWTGRGHRQLRSRLAYATARVLRPADGPDEMHRKPGSCGSNCATPASLNGGSDEVPPRDPSAGFCERPLWIA